MLESLAADLKYALRSFQRAPGFTATAFITLVAGIAGITSLFSYTNAAYFGALPYKDADRIVAIGQTQGLFTPEASPAAIQLVRESSKSFERLAVFNSEGVALSIGDEPVPAYVLHVDTSFQAMFGLRPQLGRFLTPAEIAGDAPVAVIASTLWRSRFGADSSIVGRELKLSNGTHTIVGVLPEGFRYPWRTDVITPLRMSVDPADFTEPEYGLIGKLRPGVPRATAQSEIATLGSRLKSPRPRDYGWQLHANDEMVNRRANLFMPVPQLFLGFGLFVLLIACGNVANLFLARGAERSREMAVRASLGATRWRLIRQSLTETLVLGAAAAALGTALSGAIVKLALTFIPTDGFPSWFHVSIDYRVLAFTVAVTLLVTVATGLMPARVATQFDLTRSLKVGGDGGATTGSIVSSSKRGLAVQLALAVALFASSLLFVRTYFKIAKVDVGYPAAEIATVMPSFDQARYPTWDPRLPFAEGIAERAATLPGVRAAAVRGPYAGPRLAPGATAGKPAGDSRYDGRLIPDGDTTRAIRYLRGQSFWAVSDEYFALLRLKVVAGRGFGPSDRMGSEPVVAISSAAAKRLWPLSPAIGRTLQIGAQGEKAQVVGVVSDTYEMMGGRDGRSSEARAVIYFPVRQATSTNPEILASGRGADPLAARSAIVNAVRTVDPHIVIMNDRRPTLAAGQESALMETRVFGGLIGAFAVVALGLSIIGIYGVVAFGVSRRTREIGIRMALGGTMAQVTGLIMRDSLKFVLIGLAIGLVLAVGLGRLVRVLLYGVSSSDPLTYGVVCVIFGTVGVVACYLPARRAARVDPLVALRAD